MSDKSNPRVLLADDSLFFRRPLAELLEGEGWQVTQAADGATALRLALEILPDLDLLILDVEMPGKNGLEVLEAVRGHDGGGAVPTVILSGHALGSDERLKRLDVRATLEKSMPIPEMAQRIVELFRGGATMTAGQ